MHKNVQLQEIDLIQQNEILHWRVAILEGVIKKLVKGYSNLIDVEALPAKHWDDEARRLIKEGLDAIEATE